MLEEIPQRAFINAQILQTIQDDPAFRRAVKQVIADYRIAEYQFMNSAYVASLLYCLLVVPRHVFVETRDNNLDERLPAQSITQFFHVLKDDQNAAMRSSFFLRRLRNSVAHVRYTVDTQMNFTFADRPYRSKTDDYVVSASAAGVMQCLSVVGGFLANLRTERL